MDFSWIAGPYGLAAVCVVCILAGFAINKGIYWDKDDKVLKIGSKKHPETLEKFNELIGAVESIRHNLDEFKIRNEETQMNILKSIITNTQLPPQQRADAYDEYKRRGGNSWVRAYFEDDVLPLVKQAIRDRSKKTEARHERSGQKDS